MEIRKLAKADFPAALMQIPDPPKDLWIIGSLPPAERSWIYLCVVGSRRITSYGREVCERIISGLRGYPIIIVSGFALGIDIAAHKAAMNAGLRTIAFPGSGLSGAAIYPKNNAHLINKIADAGGCLLSEFEPDFQATMWSFPQRNRLMAGMARATMVIEAAERSGTLITANLALEYNRDLLAIPGPIFTPGFAGTNRLIRQGAIVVTCPEDVLEALGFERPNDEEKRKMALSDLSPEEKAVAEILHEPLPRDEIIRRLNWNISRANIILSAMEIKEIIKEEMGMICLR